MAHRARVVVDASVVVKWLAPEPHQEQALHLLGLYKEEKVDLIAPFLLLSEVGNVLWRRVRVGDLTLDQGRQCFERLLDHLPLLAESPEMSRSAFELAVAHDRTVYDCTYLACALERQCDLVTADARFFNAVGPAFSAVKLLRDI